ncbi:MAG: hypothetical protein ACE5H9_12285 [Anaerolineae bacterium]
MSSTLPTFLPLADAARKHNLPEKVLTQLIRDGKIEAAKLPSGEILVSDHDLDQGKTKEQIIAKKYGNLRGRPITITDAAKKYNVPRGTLNAWVFRSNYIRIVDDLSYPKKIDEAEAAYCAEIYHARKRERITGIPFFDEEGRPYKKLKHPKLSKYRRLKRKGSRLR